MGGFPARESGSRCPVERLVHSPEAKECGRHRRTGVAGTDHAMCQSISHGLRRPRERRIGAGAHGCHGFVSHGNDFCRGDDLQPCRRARTQQRANSRGISEEQDFKFGVCVQSEERSSNRHLWRLVATHRAERNGDHDSNRVERSVNVDCDAALVGPAIAAYDVRKFDHSAVRAHRLGGSFDLHIGRTTATGLMAGCISLRDRHGNSSCAGTVPVRLQARTSEPVLLTFFDFLIARCCLGHDGKFR